MVTRPASVCSGKQLKPDKDDIHALFSASAVRRQCGRDQTSVDEQVQVIADVIDTLLLEMAAEGYVHSASESEIAETLVDIRRTGRLTAVSDKQPRMAIKCTVPIVASGKFDVEEKSTKPIKAWSELGSRKYEFVGRK